jgi:hypothetical protein
MMPLISQGIAFDRDVSDNRNRLASSLLQTAYVIAPVVKTLKKLRFDTKVRKQWHEWNRPEPSGMP